MVLIQPEFDAADKYLSLCREENVGFELLEFAFPALFYDESKKNEYISTYRNSPCKALHGALVDINVASTDPLIAEVSKTRCIQSCQIAEELGIRHVVFHSNFLPSIPGIFYRQNWCDKNREFYLKLLDEYDINIYIENTLDYHPDMLLNLMESVKCDRLGVCFDAGHANLSKSSMNEWFDVLHKYMKYIHLSDNLGVLDDHIALGEGTVDWPEVFKLIGKYSLDPIFTIEVDGFASVQRSISYLKKLRPW